MPRIARVVAPGIPHHVIQRGNRKQKVFFKTSDYRTYLQIMSYWCQKSGVEIWAYCLMPNHVHMIAVPSNEKGLSAAIGEAHRRYTLMINKRMGWTGYLWQGRFLSCPMNENYCLAAARYIELNPVEAGIVEKPEDYKWSSAKAHLESKDDGLVKVKPILNILPEWDEFLKINQNEDELDFLSRCTKTGRPCGEEVFTEKIEIQLNRTIKKRKKGRPKKIK